MSINATFMDSTSDGTTNSQSSRIAGIIDLSDARKVGVIVGMRWEGSDATASVDNDQSDTFVSVGKVSNDSGSDNLYTEVFVALDVQDDTFSTITGNLSASRDWLYVHAISFSYEGNAEVATAITGFDIDNDSSAAVLDSSLSAVAGDMAFQMLGNYSGSADVSSWNGGFTAFGVEVASEAAYNIGAYSGTAGCSLDANDTWNLIGVVIQEVGGSSFQAAWAIHANTIIG